MGFNSGLKGLICIKFLMNIFIKFWIFNKIFTYTLYNGRVWVFFCFLYRCRRLYTILCATQYWNVKLLRTFLFYDLLTLCTSKHVSLKSLQSGEVVSCHLLCCFFFLEGNTSFWVYGDLLCWKCRLLFCYLWAILLVVETVFDFHSNGRGFFPTLVSRNDGVVLLFLLHCFDALEYFEYCADIPPV